MSIYTLGLIAGGSVMIHADEHGTTLHCEYLGAAGIVTITPSEARDIAAALTSAATS